MGRVREPFIHITRREGMPFWKGLCIRVGAVAAALLIAALLLTLSAPNSKGFGGFFKSLFEGTFYVNRRGEMNNFWLTLQETALLLCVAIALVVAFKMKFWNLGGNGQVLMGCLACAACMYYLGGETEDPLVWLLMLVASVAAGAVWALIPALFKAFFNTNESLFTLMMNYVAFYLVVFFVALWYPEGTGVMPPLSDANLPTFGAGQMGKSLPVILVAVLVTAAIFCYLRFSKHGYEIGLIGDSKNTARYAGINVKKVIIRTLVLSGALCGLVGFLLVGSINHMVSKTMDGNRGFTGIMVAWMGKFNPLIMTGVSLFIVFLTRGMAQVCSDFGISNDALSDVVIGLIYFFLIGCEFFISYRVHFNVAGRRSRPAPVFAVEGAQKDGSSEASDASGAPEAPPEASEAPEETGAGRGEEAPAPPDASGGARQRQEEET